MCKSFIHLNSEDHWLQTWNFMKNKIKNWSNFMLTTKQMIHTLLIYKALRKSLYKDPQISQKSRRTPQNSRCQTAHINQVPFSELTSIRCHQIKFCRPGNLAPWVCAPPIHTHARSCLRWNFCPIFSTQFQDSTKISNKNSHTEHVKCKVKCHLFWKHECYVLKHSQK